MNRECPLLRESEDILFKKAQQLAEQASYELKENYGLDKLSNIEFVGPRRIAAEVLTELKINKANQESLSDFSPKPETIVRFLNEFYNVHPADLYENLNPLDENYENEIQKRKESLKKYLRKKQDKMHKL